MRGRTTEGVIVGSCQPFELLLCCWPVRRRHSVWVLLQAERLVGLLHLNLRRWMLHERFFSGDWRPTGFREARLQSGTCGKLCRGRNPHGMTHAGHANANEHE